MSQSGGIPVRYVVTSPHFRDEWLPAYASHGAAGLDLHACLPESLRLAPKERVRIPTGISIQLPGRDYVALVYARSGLAWRHGVALPNGVGVIDSDYTGEVQVLLTNFSDVAVDIHPGDRIAQLVLSPVYTAAFVRAQSLDETERGASGFGSTGVRDSRTP